MRKVNVLLLILTSTLLLCACSVRSDASELYKQETPLKVEINMPESIDADREITVQAILTQEGKKLERANFVHFEFWKKDGSVRYPMKEAQEVGEGVYQIAVNFKSEGLYYLEVHAGNNRSLINPRQQFIVGDLSEIELDALKQGMKKDEGMHNHHH